MNICHEMDEFRVCIETPISILVVGASELGVRQPDTQDAREVAATGARSPFASSTLNIAPTCILSPITPSHRLSFS